LFGQAVFQPLAVKIHNFWRGFAARASGQVLVSWHVSETWHLWRSVSAQAQRARGSPTERSIGLGWVSRYWEGPLLVI